MINICCDSIWLLMFLRYVSTSPTVHLVKVGVSKSFRFLRVLALKLKIFSLHCEVCVSARENEKDSEKRGGGGEGPVLSFSLSLSLTDSLQNGRIWSTPLWRCLFQSCLLLLSKSEKKKEVRSWW